MFGVHPVRAVPLAAFIPSRVPGRGRGAWGGSASKNGQAGPITWASCRRGEGEIAGGLAPGGGQNTWRPRAWPLARRAVHAARAACAAAGGARQRICPSRMP
jgi:hypothetical protein